MAYTKYSLTPANNTATPPDGAPEGMLPSAVNDTMRDMMAQIRDCGDGIRDGTYTMTAPKITGGTITGAAFTGNTFTSPVISGGSINNTPIGGTTANSGAFTTLSASGVATISAGTVSAPALTTTGDTNTGIFFPAADTIAFTEGGAEAMRIDSSGNVGIGTSSPARRIDARSTSSDYQYRAGDSANPVLSYDFGRENTAGLFKFYGNQTGATGYIFDGVDGERMRITTTGNVGIGTNNPQARLHVSNSAGAALYLGFSAGSTNIYDGVHVFRDASQNERMRIDSSGNVQIGTSTSSGANLTIYGASEGRTIYQTSTSGTGAGNGFYVGMSGADALVYSYENGAMVFATNSAERMRIDSSGNVGIGTTTPDIYSQGGKQLCVSNTATNGYSWLTLAGSGTGGGEVDFGNQTVRHAAIASLNGSGLAFYTNGSNSGAAVSERMRIVSAGYLLVNTTTLNNGAQINVVGNNTTNGTYEWASPKGTNNSHMHYGTYGDWYIRPANNSGKVYVLNYQAESDERLKKDIAPINYGLAEIQQLQPRQFRWKNGDDSEVNGFIAQEVEEVLPALVSEGQWKSVDYQGITAILVKAIQEQQAMIEELKQEVAALKAK